MTTLKPLTKKQVSAYSSKCKDWKLTPAKTKLSRTFEFDTFVSALAFCAKVAVHAEVLDHHPDLLIHENTVKVTLTSKQVKGLSKLDFTLAERIDDVSYRATR